MKRHGIAAGWVVGNLLICLSAGAVTPDHKYEGIAKRNVFQLKPVPPSSEVKPPPVPVPKITLNGTTTVSGRKLALMTAELPARPGNPARIQSLVLTEGQRDGEIEVLDIDTTAGIVHATASGMALRLDFQK